MNQRLLNLYRLTKDIRERGKLFIQIKRQNPDIDLRPSNIEISPDDFKEYDRPEEIAAFVDPFEAWYDEEISDEHRFSLVPYLDLDTLLDPDTISYLGTDLIDQIVKEKAPQIRVKHLNLSEDIRSSILRNLPMIFNMLNTQVVDIISSSISSTLYRRLPSKRLQILSRKLNPSQFLLNTFDQDPEGILPEELQMMKKEDRQKLAIKHDISNLLQEGDMDENLMQEALNKQRSNVANSIYEFVYGNLEDTSDQYFKYKEKYNHIHRSDERYANLLTPQGTRVINIPSEFLVEIEDEGLLYAFDAMEPLTMNPFTKNPIPDDFWDRILEIRDQYPEWIFREDIESRKVRTPEYLVKELLQKDRIKMNKQILEKILQHPLILRDTNEDNLLLVLAAYLLNHRSYEELNGIYKLV